VKLEKITLQDVSDENIRDDPFTDVRNVLNAVDELSAELMDCIIGKSGSGNTRDVSPRECSARIRTFLPSETSLHRLMRPSILFREAKPPPRQGLFKLRCRF
jgi:hypothetical protein